MEQVQRRRRVLSGMGRATVVLVSTATLGASALGWTAYRGVTVAVTTDDVIAAPATPSSRDKAAATDTTFLLVGVDSRTDAQGRPLPREVLDELQAGNAGGEQNTDTMILVHVPADRAKKAFAVSLPRDSYVDIAGGFGNHKLNSAYARAKNAAGGNATAGRRTLIETVNALTGLRVDHYAEINMYAFSQITKAVGGVPVCLNKAVKDSYSGADFPQGEQVLQGADALKFVRQRHGLPRGDLDRVRRQQAFLAGLASRVLSAGTLTDPAKVTGLLEAIKTSVVLDQNWDLLSLAEQAQGLGGGRIEFHTIPTVRSDLATPGDGTAVEVNPKQVKAFVQDLLNAVPAPPVQMRQGLGGGGGEQQAPETITANGVHCVN
ncbi:LCP family protein [Allokutzneria albata]|uniref:Cell envelope-related function transcriptional attenuator common domain-containing protein n=1 Tax=Allokutzneria albata TaxID=211114 RepID=A0A1G9TMY3_ALLAB|nr:LCP family protein [Allokutzneria albata]SDM49041.1 cell envelope-related function transcriptional attenuator common domain-containing protein [Allokutzneria albata]